VADGVQLSEEEGELRDAAPLAAIGALHIVGVISPTEFLVLSEAGGEGVEDVLGRGHKLYALVVGEGE